MGNIRFGESFEWNENKAELNPLKHNGITFEEATSVFEDENAILFDDPDHSEDEDRFILLGMSNQANILIVCHCYRGANEIIRIYSARKATPKEAKQYIEITEGW